MKKRIFALAVVMICLSILASTTLAYFTDIGTARNVITSGGVHIAVEEWQQTAAGLTPYPKEQPIVVMPATTVSKLVTVKNHEAESFIRARLELTIKDPAGKEMTVSAAELEKLIRLHMNTGDWMLKDGWWYYGEPVDTDKATRPLMTAVEFDGPNMTNEYQNCTVEVHVYAQAVQTANNGISALEALGWPETE